MPLDERIEALRSRHAALDTLLQEEHRRPAPDDGAIAKIKREKLKLKDELARLVHH
jgi:hypothetical protein